MSDNKTTPSDSNASLPSSDADSKPVEVAPEAIAEEEEAVEALDATSEAADETFEMKVLDADSSPVVEAQPASGGSAKAAKDKKGKSKGLGAHAKAAQSAYIQKSTRMRRVLIVVIVLLVVLAAAIVILGFQIFDAARTTAVQQTQISENDSSMSDEEASDASQPTAKKTTVPDIVSLFGKTQDEAIATLEHGAQITRSLEVNEEGNPIKTDVQIALTAEPSDSRTGTPTVYIGMDETGHIIQVGYSAATSSLGYGSLSFSDAVINENIVEKTLAEAGLTVSFGSATLPEDKMAYSTYGTDGTTLMKEYCAFEGVGMASGVEHRWEAILSYDYSMANATGNLNDTIRTIYVYVMS